MGVWIVVDGGVVAVGSIWVLADGCDGQLWWPIGGRWRISKGRYIVFESI